MVEKERVDLDQQEINVSDYITVYQALSEMKTLDESESLLEYNLPKLTPSWFTYHKKKDKKTGKFLDDGKCQVCGKDRQYLLIKPGLPHICHRCYQAARGYRNLLFDPLHLKSKRDLTAGECKKIVKYMNTYSKQKLVALAAVGAYLVLDKNK